MKKRCPSCHQLMDLSFFHRANADAHHSFHTCKFCRKKEYEAKKATDENTELKKGEYYLPPLLINPSYIEMLALAIAQGQLTLRMLRDEMSYPQSVADLYPKVRHVLHKWKAKRKS